MLDFPTNVACRGSAQRGLERSHVSSVEWLAHSRGVGRHADEPDVGMRLHMEGQELLTDVHGTHIHEANPWGSAAIGVHDSGVQPCEEGCEDRRLKKELGVHVGHKVPGDVAARVHDDVLFASGEPPAFKQWQHLAARLVDVDDAVAISDASIVQCPLDLLLAQFSECPCRCFGP